MNRIRPQRRGLLQAGISETHAPAIEVARTTSAKVAATTEVTAAATTTEMAAPATESTTTTAASTVTGRPCRRAEQQECDANYAS
jgi:hypothetical protein